MNNLYDLFVAIIIGATEGFTEFLPISSTAHNSLVGKFLLNGKDFGLEVSNIFQFGALVAIIQYFWSDICGYLVRIKDIILNTHSRKEFFGNVNKWRKGNFEKELESRDQILLHDDQKIDFRKQKEFNFNNDIMIVELILATIPAAIIGLLMHDVLKGLRSYIWIGFFLIIGSMLMGIADWYYNKSEHKEIKYLSKLQVFNIGLFQTLGIFPGISRSGATVSGTFFLGIDRTKAVRFAFLLGIPILALAGIYDGLKTVLDISKTKDYPVFFNPNVMIDGKISMLGILLGAIVAYFVALASLKWLLKYLSTHSFTPFIVYRIFLGLFLIMISLAGNR
jgi:undecaprenyl-diphosphatase